VLRVAPKAFEAVVLEEYKNVHVRIETHERHFYQMLVLSFTALAAIVSVSEKVPHYAIPLMCGSILYVTTAVARTSRAHQAFATAYIIERFDVKTLACFEHTYCDVFAHEYNRAGFYLKGMRALLLDPFSVLTELSVLVALYFGREYVVTEIAQGHHAKVVLYCLVCAGLYVLAIRNVYKWKRMGTAYYRTRCQTALDGNRVKILMMAHEEEMPKRERS
jgi:hypothetical protein